MDILGMNRAMKVTLMKLKTWGFVCVSLCCLIVPRLLCPAQTNKMNDTRNLKEFESMYKRKLQEYEGKLKVPWAHTCMEKQPEIVLHYLWISDINGRLEIVPKYYRIPRSQFLAECYCYYLRDESKRVAPGYSAAVTWWQFLSLIGEGKGDWKSDLGTKIDKPDATDFIVTATRNSFYGLDPKDYKLCKGCGHKWRDGICKGGCRSKLRCK
jgi:hypothetical protein